MQQDKRKPVFKAMDYISQNLCLNPTLEEIGSITVGKSADLVLFDRNLEKVSIEELRDAKVLWTLVEGRKVYQAN